MAGLKGMLETGAIIIIGIIALKAFGGIKGISDLIGGISGMLSFDGGGGGAAPAPAPAPIIPVGELPPGSTVDIITPPVQDPLEWWTFLSPILGATEMWNWWQSRLGDPTITHVDVNGNGDYTPSPNVPTPPSPDPILPDQPMVWIQPPSMLPDPFRPGVGGR